MSQEQFAHRHALQAKGYDFDWLVSRVADLFEMSIDEDIRAGRYPATVKSRSELYLITALLRILLI